MGARYVELLEIDPTRFVCSFETRMIPAAALARMSRRWRTLTFILDYEIRKTRIKGIMKLKGGMMESCAIHY